jgi:hypothetical protein
LLDGGGADELVFPLVPELLASVFPFPHSFFGSSFFGDVTAAFERGFDPDPDPEAEDDPVAREFREAVASD